MCATINLFCFSKLQQANSMDLKKLTDALTTHMPPIMRWAGTVARRIRKFDIAVDAKSSGSANTDALTIADLSVQELIVACLRDTDPIFRQCRLQGEESTGDFERFATEAPYSIVIDPIDGTKGYRDREGCAYSVMLSLQTPDSVEYSLVYIPEQGENGSWVFACGDIVATGPDDPSRPAADVVRTLAPIVPSERGSSKKIYLIGYQKQDAEKAQLVTDAGLEGVLAADMGGCHYWTFARGEFTGSLIHSPNIYDFPVGMHIARILGGDALWVHNEQPVHLRETWLDERADMERLPGIVACSADRTVLKTLCELARDWNPVRYHD